MKLLLSLLLLINALFAAYEDDLDPETAYVKQKSGESIIVDVRTTIEYLYTGHGEGFINIPYLEWSYIPKSIKTRVESAAYEIKNSIVKDHKGAMKLYDAKEVVNKNFVSEVMKAMKMQGARSVILICRSGPRSKAAANKLSEAGITAYNLEGGFLFGWKENSLPYGGE